MISLWPSQYSWKLTQGFCLQAHISTGLMPMSPVWQKKVKFSYLHNNFHTAWKCQICELMHGCSVLTYIFFTSIASFDIINELWNQAFAECCFFSPIYAIPDNAKVSILCLTDWHNDWFFRLNCLEEKFLWTGKTLHIKVINITVAYIYSI